VLDDELIAMTLDELRQRLASRTENSASEVPEIEAEMSLVKVELERLGNALVGANEKPAMVMRMIAERERRLAELNARLENARATPLLPNMDFATIEAVARERLKDLHGMLSRHPEAAHRVMEAILGGPLTFTAKDHRYHIEGHVGADWMALVEGSPKT
jgi:chromosome segregation ATPase